MYSRSKVVPTVRITYTEGVVVGKTQTNGSISFHNKLLIFFYSSNFPHVVLSTNSTSVISRFLTAHPFIHWKASQMSPSLAMPLQPTAGVQLFYNFHDLNSTNMTKVLTVKIKTPLGGGKGTMKETIFQEVSHWERPSLFSWTSVQGFLELMSNTRATDHMWSQEPLIIWNDADSIAWNDSVPHWSNEIK